MILVKVVNSFSRNNIMYYLVETEEQAKNIFKSYFFEYDEFAKIYRDKDHPTKIYGTSIEMAKGEDMYYGSELITDPLYGTITELKLSH